MNLSAPLRHANEAPAAALITANATGQQQNYRLVRLDPHKFTLEFSESYAALNRSDEHAEAASTLLSISKPAASSSAASTPCLDENSDQLLCDASSSAPTSSVSPHNRNEVFNSPTPRYTLNCFSDKALNDRLIKLEKTLEILFVNLNSTRDAVKRNLVLEEITKTEKSVDRVKDSNLIAQQQNIKLELNEVNTKIAKLKEVHLDPTRLVADSELLKSLLAHVEDLINLA